MTTRTSLKLTDERLQLLDKASEIVSSGDNDDPPRADVLDAALTHLIESQENIEDARDTHPPHTVKEIANTSVLRLYYRTGVESPWRK